MSTVRHNPFAIDERARNRWVELMDRALDESQLAPQAVEVLRPFLHDTATFMINRRGAEEAAK